jgi:hypothetical protein
VEDAVFIHPKKEIEARAFPANLWTRNSLERGGLSRYAANPLILPLSPDHSYKNRFRP